MKSVLFINYEYPPVGAGAANANYNIAVSMAAKGFRVSVLTSAFKSQRGLSSENGVSVYRVPALRKNAGQSSLMQMLAYDISALLHLSSVLKDEKPDAAVVFFSIPCGPIGLFLRHFYKVPYHLLLRGGDVPGFEAKVNLIHRILRPLRRLIYKKSRTIIANSEGLRDLALKADPGFDIKIINNGVDTDFFFPSVEKQNDPFVFLFAGRFCEQKNLGILLKAFSKINCKYKETRLILLGDGPSRKSLENLAESLNVSNSIRWVNWCSKEKLRSYYQTSHCFINPSINEGMSNAVLEAMACGLPVLGGDCIGNREIIFNGENGFLFNPQNSTELSERMRLFVEDRNCGRQMGEKGREICRERFSWPALTDQLISLINTGD